MTVSSFPSGHWRATFLQSSVMGLLSIGPLSQSTHQLRTPTYLQLVLQDHCMPPAFLSNGIPPDTFAFPTFWPNSVFLGLPVPPPWKALLFKELVA